MDLTLLVRFSACRIGTSSVETPPVTAIALTASWEIRMQRLGRNRGRNSGAALVGGKKARRLRRGEALGDGAADGGRIASDTGVSQVARC
jgi:hypothetical protein